MRREQHIRTQTRFALKLDIDQQYVAVTVGRDAQIQCETFMLMNNLQCRNALCCPYQLVAVHALHFNPETLVVGNDETEIADLRNIDARIKHFIHDAAADGEPQARRP